MTRVPGRMDAVRHDTKGTVDELKVQRGLLLVRKEEGPERRRLQMGRVRIHGVQTLMYSPLSSQSYNPDTRDSYI